MKTKIYNLLSLILIVSGMYLFTSCDESLKIDKVVQGNPSILSFEPTSGKAGVEITISGENLRGVKTATLGGVEARIRYVISQQSVVIVVPQGAKSGAIILKTGDDKIPPAQSEQSFTVVYPVPTYTNIPSSGKVDGEIEIQGSNLDMVSKVLFKDVEGVITYQSEKELVVKVPFVADDNVDVSLFYTNEAGEQSTGTTGKAFEIIKPRPGIDGTFPANLIEGESVTLTGVNLKLIEKILFGDVEASISRSDDNALTIRVPTLPATATVAVVASYYQGTATLNLSDACQVFIPKVLYYPNQMFGAHRNANFGNMFNASTGVVSTTCILKEAAAQATIDFAGVINSGIHFAINGPHNTTGGLRNYWCDGKALAKSNTMDGLISEGFGDFMTTKTLFRVLTTSDAQEAEIINKVTTGQILELSPDATPTLFNGTIVAANNSCRTRNVTENSTDVTLLFEVGSVILFKNEKKNKVGLLYIRQINIDQSQNKAYNDANASVVFDVYYQR